MHVLRLTLVSRTWRRTLSQNKLTGSLPSQWIGNNAFNSLTALDVSANTLSGDLPAALGSSGSFGGLQLLRLGTNNFTGPNTDLDGSAAICAWRRKSKLMPDVQWLWPL